MSLAVHPKTCLLSALMPSDGDKHLSQKYIFFLFCIMEPNTEQGIQGEAASVLNIMGE